MAHAKERAAADPFVGRRREIEALNAVLGARGARFVLVYGRRRVGKTTLLLRWAEQARRPYIYWVATRDTPAQVRLGLARALWRWAHPGSTAIPRFDTWADLFEGAAQLIGDRPVTLIMDEFSYAAESDPALPSNLQAAWDHVFKKKDITLVLAGSHLGMMKDLLAHQSPLYGRFTAQLPVDPLPFSALSEFLPRYSTAERVAVYAVVGGIPAYLERFDDRKSLGANLQHLFMRRTGMFRSEPFMLIGDVIRRETTTYESILKVIAEGHHTPQEIGAQLDLTSQYLSPYLKQLTALHLVERRLPATLPPERRAKSREGRYHLCDAYLRFYFRFIAQNLALVEHEQMDLLWERIAEQLRAFVGVTAFEEISRDWVRAMGKQRRLPVIPEVVGSHWSKEEQLDVVAMSWRDRKMLVGECKWGLDRVGRDVVTELLEKAARVRPDEKFRVSCAVFARSGFTEAARAEARAHEVILLDAETMERDLREADSLP
jgi:AAA+ ATPase superfamily predicted ATPase